ncbi:MAG: sulfite exporter TauE/SafE family protein [Candidatus Methanofastidiosia archaeon]
MVAAFLMEIVDSSLGMMYGTILSPVLIGYGFESMIVVPAILLSQALGGITGTISHHKYGNADFNGLTKDMKVVLTIVIPGLLAIAIGSIVVLQISKSLLNTYIGILVIIMSILCLVPYRYKFSWSKNMAIGMVASFNKMLTGGGFGPVTSTGKILAGLDPRASVATTTFAEVGICLASFVIYVALFGVKDPLFIVSLCIGAIVGGIIGPYISSIINHDKLRVGIGALGIVSGIWILTKTFIL